MKKKREAFPIDEVVHDITAKMIHRHPHVFGTVEAADSEAVLQNWEEIKSEEKQIESVAQALRRVPPYLPALMRAQKIQGKARKKLSAGYLSSEEALAAGHGYLNGAISDQDAAENLAETVFALCAAAELKGIDLEAALSHKCDAFVENIEKKE